MKKFRTRFYTDGSYDDRCGLGAWAFVGFTPEGRVEKFGIGEFKNSSMAELEAVLQVLKFSNHKSFRIFTDCHSNVHIFNKVRRNRLCGISGEIASEISALLENREVFCSWVKGKTPNKKSRHQINVGKAHLLCKRALTRHLDSMSSLAPCFVCGSEDLGHKISGADSGKGMYYSIVCNNCDTKGPNSVKAPRKRWNTVEPSLHLCSFCGWLTIKTDDGNYCDQCRSLVKMSLP